jgi:hypothetical protein
MFLTCAFQVSRIKLAQQHVGVVLPGTKFSGRDRKGSRHRAMSRGMYIKPPI